jgi:hypothetical protein
LRSNGFQESPSNVRPDYIYYGRYSVQFQV